MLRIACGNASQNGRPQPPHESGEADRLDAALANRLDERSIIGLARRVVAMRQDERLDPAVARPSESRPRLRDSRSPPPRVPPNVPPRWPRESPPDYCRAPKSAQPLSTFPQVGGRACFPQFLPVRGQASKTRRTRHFPCLVDSPWSDKCRDDPVPPRPPHSSTSSIEACEKPRCFRASHDYREFLGLLCEGPQTPPGSSARVLHHVESLAPRCGSCRPAAALQAAPLGINYPCRATSSAPQDGRPRPCVSGAIQVARDRLARPVRPCVPLRRAKRAARATGAARPGLAMVQPLGTAERRAPCAVGADRVSRVGGLGRVRQCRADTAGAVGEACPQIGQNCGKQARPPTCGKRHRSEAEDVANEGVR